MLGAIVGDIIGSTFEWANHKSTELALFRPGSAFTDDTVLTVATAHAILTGEPYASAYHAYGNRYPRAGYGSAFRQWLASRHPQPYGSWGNGSAMRVSPVAWAFDTEEAVLAEAQRSAEPTHGHPEGIRGAQAAALATFLARTGHDKAAIRERVAAQSGYDLSRTIDEIRPGYGFDVSCQGSVPEAIIAFLEGADFEGAVRLAISLGGDADTQAAIAGGIAEAFHGGVPEDLAERAMALLDDELRRTAEAFRERFVLR